MSKLKAKIDEFVEIVKALPDNLQVVCFELLLRNHLESAGNGTDQAKSSPLLVPTTPKEDKAIDLTAVDTSNQNDFKQSDLHVKVRKFLAKNSLSIEHLNNLFFQEANEVKPLYDDLKTTKTSESQIRVVLLLALQKAMTTGEFEVETTVVKDECVKRKCYDVKNFGNNFNNKKSLFDFEKFTKDTSTVRLAEPGRITLAELIRELQ